MTDFKDPFIMLRRIFIDVNSYKITKLCDFTVITFHSLVLCLQLYYMIRHFDVNLSIKYGPITAFFLFMTVSAVLSGALSQDIFRAVAFFEKISWSLDVIRKEARIKLERKCQVINTCISCILLFSSTTMVINLPFCENQRYFFISNQVFEEYFGKWSVLLNVFYYSGVPYLGYHSVKPCFVFVYAILEIQLQFSLIEEYLLQTYETDYLESGEHLEDTQYQREIGEALRRCITHHVQLKKLIDMMVDIVLMYMPFFLVLGVFLLITCFAFIINFADTTTNTVKVQAFMFVVTALCNTVLFCWNGQQLIDVTNSIFLTLGGAPWYHWNVENIKILLMFITNCTKNDSIVLAGICLDYKMFVFRISVSYALVLFNLRKRSLV
ncbi:odorant receptor 223 [Tribolium castaneum]|uniref:Odorant receptor n=1 Tax=Tribolium castaneum TaxID=7070 RepID=D6WHL9_TRICA|nr:odorant receptor 223 [Tribolium castaneum]